MPGMKAMQLNTEELQLREVTAPSLYFSFQLRRWEQMTLQCQQKGLDTLPHWHVFLITQQACFPFLPPFMYSAVAPSHRSVMREEYEAIHRHSNTATFPLLKEANELQCGFFHRLCFELVSHEGKLVCGNMRGQKPLHLPSLSVLRKDLIVTVVSNLGQQSTATESPSCGPSIFGEDCFLWLLQESHQQFEV